jgi:phosphoglycolate phosphatase-like HAD superfamily hydrolase
MTKAIKHKPNIVLDLDGTLLDSRHRHAVVLSDCINAINQTKYSYDNFYDFVSYKAEGNTGLAYLKSRKIPNETEIINQWIKKIEYKKYLRLDVLYPDILSDLETLYNNYNLLLVTARSNKANTIWQLSNLGITKYFHKIIIVKSMGDTGLNKYHACKTMPVKFVIGDTEVDQALAEQAHCIFYPLNNGFRSQKYWMQCKQKKSHHSLHEIIIKINEYE